MYILENDSYKVSISALGAELTSVYSKKMKKELLWQADKNIWARHAPVLFPIVGKLKNNTYTFEGKEYHLPQHGFARDKEFKLSVQTETTVELELRNTEETQLIYPFSFRLIICYELANGLIKCTYKVLNTDNKEIFFSIGAHPGFICPMYENETLNNYRIEFQEKEVSERRLLSEGLCTDDHEKVFEEPGILSLSSSLFDKDALVFDDLRSTSLRLVSDKYCLSFNWFNMPYFGIWAKKDAEKFICIEPWSGIADSVNATGNLAKKEGIIKLAVDKEHVSGFSFYVK
ncbi:MAG TPA: aldose 1-epimerase family protein [Bacteroidia bacterium]